MNHADVLAEMTRSAQACILAFGEDHPCVVQVLQMRRCVEQLAEDLAEARKDTARLDWIHAKAPICIYHETVDMCLAEIAGGFDLRGAIDLEMEMRK